MQPVNTLLLLVCATLIASVQGVCKDGEGTRFPYKGPLYNGGEAITDALRVETYPSNNPANNLAPTGGTQLRVTSYNIQSGLNENCNNNDSSQLVPNLVRQSEQLRDAHFWGLQEVDEFNDLRCNCSEPAKIADATGHTAFFFFLIYYRSGKYGSSMGTPLPYTDTRFKIFEAEEFETKGVLAIRTQPAQAPNGRHVWFMNTHLTFNAPITRTEQARELVAFTQALAAEFPQDLIILTGDFYALPVPFDPENDQSYDTLAAFFDNAWEVFNNNNRSGGETYPADFPMQRYDHVWYKFPAGVTYGINVEVRDVRDSDHRPLHVFFDFAGTQPTIAPALTTSGATTDAAATTAGATTAAPDTAATSAAATSAAATSAAATSAAATTGGATTAAPDTAATSAAATSAAATSAAATTAGATTAAPDTAATSAAATSAAATSAAATTAGATTAAPDTAATSAAATSAAATTAAANSAATTSLAAAIASTTSAHSTADAAATSANTGASSSTIAATSTNAAATTANLAAAVAAVTSANAAGTTTAAAAASTTGAAATSTAAAATTAAAAASTGFASSTTAGPDQQRPNGDEELPTTGEVAAFAAGSAVVPSVYVAALAVAVTIMQLARS